MILTFPFRVRANIPDEMSLPSIVLTMGDGYKYRYPDGLNLPKTIWNIECPLDNPSSESSLQAFLKEVGNDKPFLWQSPRDCQPRLYFIMGKIGGRYRMGGGSKKDFFVRTMQFEDANIDFGVGCGIQQIFATTYLSPAPVILPKALTQLISVSSTLLTATTYLKT